MRGAAPAHKAGTGPYRHPRRSRFGFLPVFRHSSGGRPSASVAGWFAAGLAFTSSGLTGSQRCAYARSAVGQGLDRHLTSQNVRCCSEQTRRKSGTQSHGADATSGRHARRAASTTPRVSDETRGLMIGGLFFLSAVSGVWDAGWTPGSFEVNWEKRPHRFVGDPVDGGTSLRAGGGGPVPSSPAGVHVMLQVSDSNSSQDIRICGSGSRPDSTGGRRLGAAWLPSGTVRGSTHKAISFRRSRACRGRAG